MSSLCYGFSDGLEDLTANGRCWHIFHSCRASGLPEASGSLEEERWEPHFPLLQGVYLHCESYGVPEDVYLDRSSHFVRGHCLVFPTERWLCEHLLWNPDMWSTPLSPVARLVSKKALQVAGPLSQLPEETPMHSESCFPSCCCHCSWLSLAPKALLHSPTGTAHLV